MNWPVVKLGDRCDILSGFAFKSDLFSSNADGIPLIRIRDVLPGYSSTFYSGEYDDKFIVHDGEILIGMDGDFNRARWNGGKALLNQRVCKISGKDGLDSGYLFHLLPDILQVIADRTPFVTVKHLSAKDLREFEIPLPPLPEQKRIAGILDQADALRRLRARALEKLNTLGQAIFQEMFGESEGQGGNVALSSVADVASGITKGRKINGAATRSVPYMAVSNVQDQHLKLDTVKEIEATDEEIRRYALQKNDLLLTEGGDPDKLGRGTLWNDELPECIHQNHIFRVRITSEALRPEYLKWFVGSPAAKSYFFRAAKKTTGIASINKSQLGNLPVAIPSIERQREFERKLGILDDVRVFVVVACQKADSLFASLQHRAFRGEL